MILPAEDRRRQKGLVYHDAAHDAGPAAHVMIMGVGAYGSPEFPSALTSTTISARAIADWFLDASKARFKNRRRPLGSVAMLLSEPMIAGGSGRASYAGGDIPSATHPNAKDAVRDWVTRLNSHKDNLAILYVASHGVSANGNTSFLLEDYGLDPADATAGMSNVEQFSGALENVKAVSQLLLFDCCRQPTNLLLPPGDPLGTKLISLVKAPDDHGEARKQWVIAATSLGEVALGRCGKTTLFADALIAALDGVASDPADEGWPVRPGTLIDKIDRLLALHRLPSEKAQTPGGRMAGSFNITCPGEPVDIPVYVSFGEPEQWPGSVITVYRESGAPITIKGAPDEAPFWVARFPVMTELRAEARRGGRALARAGGKAYAPATFLELKKTGVAAPEVIGQLNPARSHLARAKLVIAVDSPVVIDPGAVAEIISRTEPKKSPKRLVVPLGGEATVEIRAGAHAVTLRTPDGRVETRDVELGKDEIVRIRFAVNVPPRGRLKTAMLDPVYRMESAEPPSDRMVAGDAAAGPGSADEDALPYPPSETTGRLPREVKTAPPVLVTAEIAGFVTIDLERQAAPETMLAAVVRATGRTAVVRIVDGAHVRFLPDGPDPLGRPIFASIRAPGSHELVALPCLGRDRQKLWRTRVLVDRHAPPGATLSTVLVESRQWGGLLGFVASRDMATGDQLLTGRLADAAVDAVAELEIKRTNPLAAVAGALVVVAASRANLERRWDPWLRNLAMWFPGIPDGPIILGRRLLMRARSQKEIEDARHWLFEGFGRGVPLYSLTVDWLARGLESLCGEDPALLQRQHAARRLASRVDPTRAFTVIRLEG